MNILYHGTHQDAVHKIQRHGFNVPSSSFGVSVTDDFDMALSYTDEIDGKYQKNDVIAVIPRHGTKPVNDHGEALTGEYIYKPEDLIIIGLGEQHNFTP